MLANVGLLLEPKSILPQALPGAGVRPLGCAGMHLGSKSRLIWGHDGTTVHISRKMWDLSLGTWHGTVFLHLPSGNTQVHPQTVRCTLRIVKRRGGYRFPFPHSLGRGLEPLLKPSWQLKTAQARAEVPVSYPSWGQKQWCLPPSGLLPWWKA